MDNKYYIRILGRKELLLWLLGQKISSQRHVLCAVKRKKHCKNCMIRDYYLPLYHSNFLYKIARTLYVSEEKLFKCLFQSASFLFSCHFVDSYGFIGETWHLDWWLSIKMNCLYLLFVLQKRFKYINSWSCSCWHVYVDCSKNIDK